MYNHTMSPTNMTHVHPFLQVHPTPPPSGRQRAEAGKADRVILVVTGVKKGSPNIGLSEIAVFTARGATGRTPITQAALTGFAGRPGP